MSDSDSSELLTSYYEMEIYRPKPETGKRKQHSETSQGGLVSMEHLDMCCREKTLCFLFHLMSHELYTKESYSNSIQFHITILLVVLYDCETSLTLKTHI
jgi:hypothetical protein